MTRLMVLLVTAVWLTPQPTPAAGQDNDEIKPLVEELIELARLDENFDQMMRGMQSGVMDMARQAAERGETNRTPEQLAELESILEEEIAVLRQEMLAPMTDLTIDFYRENFTQSEVEALIEIYRTPVFQKQYELMPDFLVEISKAGLKHQMASQERMERRMRAFKQKYGID